MAVNLPTNLLRSFVAIVDSGSMLSAADKVFVTQSALSLQIKRLEDMLQQSLFTRDGRKLALTSAGEVLLDYARRVLSLNDEAVAAVTTGHFSGPIRIGMVQDFADTLLSGLLARFAELHPTTQIYARVAGTAELQGLIERNQLDIALGFAPGDEPSAIRVAPMSWYGDEGLAERPILPLAVLEKPCRFRDAAIASLEGAGIPYRIAVESPNLSTLRAAVQAGLGVTCRTHLFLADGDLARVDRLPRLPNISCVVIRASNPDEAKTRLADLATEVIRDL